MDQFTSGLQSCCLTGRLRPFTFYLHVPPSLAVFKAAVVDRLPSLHSSLVFWKAQLQSGVSAGTDGFPHYGCVSTWNELSLVPYSKTTLPQRRHRISKCDSCLIKQLAMNKAMTHSREEACNTGRICLCYSCLLIFFHFSHSSTSPSSLGGGGSLCTTTSSPTDSTGETNQQSFCLRRARLSGSQRCSARTANILILSKSAMNNRLVGNN